MIIPYTPLLQIVLWLTVRVFTLPYLIAAFFSWFTFNKNIMPYYEILDDSTRISPFLYKRIIRKYCLFPEVVDGKIYWLMKIILVQYGDSDMLFPFKNSILSEEEWGNERIQNKT